MSAGADALIRGGRRRPVLLGIDVGGTFTDAVLVAGGQLFRAKLPTTADQSEAVLAAARAGAGKGGAGDR